MAWGLCRGQEDLHRMEKEAGVHNHQVRNSTYCRREEKGETKGGGHETGLRFGPVDHPSKNLVRADFNNPHVCLLAATSLQRARR